MSEAKVVWAEGVLLGQQHLQCWDRYHESQQFHWMSLIAPQYWGVRRLTIDEAALTNGLFRILSCECVFQNKRYIQYDHRYDAPLELMLDENDSSVYLTLADNQSVDNISGYGPSRGPCMWRAQYQMTADLYDPAREREVLLARPNLELSNVPPHDRYLALKIVQLCKLTGGFSLDAQFVPASLAIDDDTVLKDLIHGCYALLRKHQQNLLLTSNGREHSLRYGITSQMTSLYLSQLISNVFCLLACSDVHPWQYYFYFRQAVTVFTNIQTGKGDDELLSYNHLDLHAVFTELHRQLESFVGHEDEKSFLYIGFTSKQRGILLSDKFDGARALPGNIFLRIRRRPNLLADAYSRFLKIADVESIHSIVMSAVSGVALTAVDHLPGVELEHDDFYYFSLDYGHPLWNRVIADGQLAVYYPQDVSPISCELMQMVEV